MLAPWWLISLACIGFQFIIIPAFSQDLPILETLVLDINEPSDLCLSADESSFYVVSDRGRLYELDKEGVILDKKNYRGHDFEGICLRKDTLWVVDETFRQLMGFNPRSLKLLREKQYRVKGALNEGWESLCLDPGSNQLLTFTEKLPVRAYSFDGAGDLHFRQKIKYPKEISGSCTYQGHYWVVSDEDRTVYKLQPDTFSVVGSWRIPVLNPEGICISRDGTLWILSDDMHRIFRFDLPQ